MAVRSYRDKWKGEINPYIEPLIHLAREMQPKNILEIGIGYDAFSTHVWIHECGANVTTVDKRDWGAFGHHFMEIHKERYKFIEGRSEEVLPYAIKQGKKYDLIYIDGDHAYEGCKRDILLCQQLLAPGGVIVMDDYGVTRGDTAVDIDDQGRTVCDYFGVKEAADECFKDWKQVLTHINFANGGRAYAKA